MQFDFIDPYSVFFFFKSCLYFLFQKNFQLLFRSNETKNGRRLVKINFK